MKETKQRMEGKCPITGCGKPCFLSETKTGNEYSFFCKTGKHRGFVDKEEDIRTLFQLQEMKDAIPDNKERGSEPSIGGTSRPATAADLDKLLRGTSDVD